MNQAELFSISHEMPDGFVYRAHFVSAAEEEQLVAAIQQLAFEEIRMHGVVAKRRTVQFGHRYGFENFKLTEAPPVPEWLLPLRDCVAAFAGCAPQRLEEVLVTEYRAGAQIGWHRDAPPFDIVVGVSLLGECTMKFRGWPVISGTTQTEKRGKTLPSPRSSFCLHSAGRRSHGLAASHPGDEDAALLDYVPHASAECMTDPVLLLNLAGTVRNSLGFVAQRRRSCRMGNSKGRDNVKKRAARRKKTERLAGAKKSSTKTTQ